MNEFQGLTVEVLCWPVCGSQEGSKAVWRAPSFFLISVSGLFVSLVCTLPLSSKCTFAGKEKCESTFKKANFTPFLLKSFGRVHISHGRVSVTISMHIRSTVSRNLLVFSSPPFTIDRSLFFLLLLTIWLSTFLSFVPATNGISLVYTCVQCLGNVT